MALGTTKALLSTKRCLDEGSMRPSPASCDYPSLKETPAFVGVLSEQHE